MRFIGLAAFSALPLQWFVLISSGTNELRLHQIALYGFTFCVAMYWGVGKVAQRLHVFIAANLYMLITLATMNLYNGDSLSQAILQFTYLALFAATAAYFYRARSASDFRLVDGLRWTALSASLVLIVALGISMISNGVNPVSVMEQAIAAGDPNILQKELFKGSFSGFGYDAEAARANMRHEVFGGLLATMYISSWATARRPLTESAQRIVYRSAMVVAILMLLVSLSRSVLTAAALWPVISFYRALVTRRVSPRQQLAAIFGVLGTAVLFITGFLDIIWIRFTEDTSSYDTRTTLLSDAVSNIAANFWTGGVDVQRSSSHNFVLDAWLRGGIFVGVPAILVFVLICLLWLRLLLQVRTLPAELMPLVVAVALPAVRLVTQGGGLMQPVEWVTLAFVMGVLAATTAETMVPTTGTQQPQPVPNRALAPTGVSTQPLRSAVVRPRLRPFPSAPSSSSSRGFGSAS